MNKKIIVLITIVVIILVGATYYLNYLKLNKKDSHGCFISKGYSWCDFKNQCVKEGEEDCSLTQDWILSEAKKIIGLDLNLIPEVIKWNTKEGELILLDAEGYYYLDLLEAEKITEGFKNWDDLLKNNNFKEDSSNPAINEEKSDSRKYINGDIVCEAKRVDNPNDTSSVSIFCANFNERLYSFKSSSGKECGTNNDCTLVTDGCAKRIVCRNKNSKFYQDCANPTAKVSELEVDINSCLCLENQCVPENEKFRSKN